jgi:phosphoglycolate phosphatase
MIDCDGVIVDSLDVFATAFIDSCTAFGVPGFTTSEDLLAVMEDNFFAGMRARGVEDELVAKVLGRVGEALVRARRWLRPFPLIPQVLEVLGETRTVVIVTSGPAEVVEAWLRNHSVAGVAEVAGAEAARSKVEKIHRLTGRFPEQDTYWFVSDTAGDMREAREAGVTPLGVAWGWHSPELLLAAGAERIVQTPIELLAVVAPDLEADFFGAV